MQVALGQTKFSKDGKLMAYTLSSGGSDWVNIRVLTIDQDTGDTTDLDDKLEYVKFSSLAWTHDHKVGCHHHASAAALLHHVHRSLCEAKQEMTFLLYYKNALSRNGCRSVFRTLLASCVKCCLT